MRRIGLVACAATKLDCPAAACNLYVSPLFRMASAYCSREYDAWYVLSAKHGLLHPNTMLDPYDQALNTMSASERNKWEVRTTQQIVHEEPVGQLYFHAGKRYAQLGQRFGDRAVFPVSGLGIGQQMAWYKARA